MPNLHTYCRHWIQLAQVCTFTTHLSTAASSLFVDPTVVLGLAPSFFLSLRIWVGLLVFVQPSTP
jgi:hypothetical protein